MGEVQLEDMIRNALNLLEDLLKSRSITCLNLVMHCAASLEGLYVDGPQCSHLNSLTFQYQISLGIRESLLKVFQLLYEYNFEHILPPPQSMLAFLVARARRYILSTNNVSLCPPSCQIAHRMYLIPVDAAVLQVNPFMVSPPSAMGLLSTS